ALGGRLVHLQRVLEVEQLQDADAIVDETVERRQQRRAAQEVAVQIRGIEAPLALDAFDYGGLTGLADVDRLHRHRSGFRSGDAERGQPALVLPTPGLLDGRDGEVGRVDALGEVP